MGDGLNVVLVMQDFFVRTSAGLQIFFSIFLLKWGVTSTRF